MSGIHYYLLSALPGLGELGSIPPISRQGMFQMASASATITKLLEILFLGDDLVQRQAFLAGQISDLDLVILSTAQARGDQPLPVFLTADSPDAARRIFEDQIWSAYYYWAAQRAKKNNSSFLSRWIAQEVALRNALVLARAKSLDLDPTGYQIAPDLADPDQDFNSLLSEWAQAGNPLQGERILDGQRWKWLKEHESWFRFNNNEVLAYAAQLMILIRWHRLQKTEIQENTV